MAKKPPAFLKKSATKSGPKKKPTASSKMPKGLREYWAKKNK